MHSSSLFFFFFASIAHGLHTFGREASLFGREPGTRIVNPAAVQDTKCGDNSAQINHHDINVALLAICGSIVGKIEKCEGNPTSTTGSSGTAHFTLKAASGTIDISKGRWEGCVAAARAVCGDIPFKSTCVGGANGNKENVQFSLDKR